MTQQNRASTGKTYRGGKRGLGASVALILGAVFALEGGFVDHPNDPGGATNHGITEQVARDAGFSGEMRDLRRWCPDQLEALIEEPGSKPRDICADGILFQRYIVAPNFDDLIAIDEAVAEEVIDTGVNMGPRRPSRYFQRAVNAVCGTRLAVDGRLGRLSIGAWRDCRENLGPPACVAMLDSLDGQQEREYDRLVRVNPRLRVFRRGWQNHRIGNVSRDRCHAS